MRDRLLVAVLLLIAAAYLGGMLLMAYAFISAGSGIAVGLGLAVLLLLAISAWAIIREVQFGVASGRLTARYEADRAADTDPAAGSDSAARPGTADPGPAAGEADGRAAARAEFEAARTALGEPGAEEDWRAWFRLALAYDALRDRRNARMALRRAIAQERASRRR